MKKRTIKIEVLAVFGSEFQEETATKSLEVMMMAWKIFYENNHKMNMVLIEIDDKPVF